MIYFYVLFSVLQQLLDAHYLIQDEDSVYFAWVFSFLFALDISSCNSAEILEQY